VALAFVSQMSSGDATQLGIDQRQQTIQGRFVALAYSCISTVMEVVGAIMPVTGYATRVVVTRSGLCRTVPRRSSAVHTRKGRTFFPDTDGIPANSLPDPYRCKV